MPLTRVQNQEAFTHVVTMVFGIAATEPLPLALERVGMKEITNLVSMKEEALGELEYDSGTAQAPLVVAVPRHLRAFISLLQTFVLYRTTEGNPIGSLDDWKAVTYEAFADFGTSSAVVPGGAPSPRTVTASGSSTVTPVEVFRKGIKRDANAFSALKDMKQWDQYKRSTKAQARAQGVAEVLDPTFTPVLQDNKDLFEARSSSCTLSSRRPCSLTLASPCFVPMRKRAMLIHSSVRLIDSLIPSRSKSIHVLGSP